MVEDFSSVTPALQGLLMIPGRSQDRKLTLTLCRLISQGDKATTHSHREVKGWFQASSGSSTVRSCRLSDGGGVVPPGRLIKEPPSILLLSNGKWRRCWTLLAVMLRLPDPGSQGALGPSQWQSGTSAAAPNLLTQASEGRIRSGLSTTF